MKPLALKTSSQLLAVWLAVGLTVLAAASPGETTTLMTGNNIFALDLYAKLQGTEGNLFFSPYSISACLGMTAAGARGETARQMRDVLHFDAQRAEVQAGFEELQKQLNGAAKDGLELAVANALWAQQDHSFLPAYLDVARQRFDAEIKQVDFKTAAEPARHDINGWVSEKTKGKIPEIIGPGTLDGSTRLVLINAIYFKGGWSKPFRPGRTIVAPFWLPGGALATRVPLMNMSAEFNYSDADGVQVLQLPYAGGGVSMFVLLPHDRDGLKAVETGLDRNKLDRWIADVRPREVNVFLPKFKLETQFVLNQPLAAMGMKDAFGSQADFSGMDGARDLYISEVIHKAFVDVNEEGTEAAAATGSIVRASAMRRPEPIPIFRADHPFIFLIRDGTSGSILFFGRLEDPGK